MKSDDAWWMGDDGVTGVMRPVSAIVTVKTPGVTLTLLKQLSKRAGAKIDPSWHLVMDLRKLSLKRRCQTREDILARFAFPFVSSSPE